MADTSLIFNIIARDKTSATFDKIKGGAVIAGAAIGAALMSAVGAAIDKAKVDNKIASQLGASPAQAKEIGKLSGAVFAAGFGEDIPQVGNAIKAAAQNGLVNMKQISSQASQDTIKNLLTVSSTLDEETDRVSSAVSQMLRTGLAKSSKEAMDILVTATQKGVNKSQDLLDTVNEYGTQFRKLGLDGKQSMGLLSQAIKAGARDSDTAADALKEFSIRSIDGSKSTAKAYQQLGLSADLMQHKMAKGGDSAAAGLQIVLMKLRGIKDPAKQSAAAVGLFGTKAEDLGQALYAMDVDTAASAMGKVGGATAAASATASAGAASWGTLGRQFQMALVDTLNKALPVANAVFGFMQRNSSWVQPLAIGLTALAVAIGIVTAVQWAWNAAQLASPTTWIILAIVALVAVIVLVATKTRFFQTIWEAVWGFMKAVGAWFAGPFAGFFVALWNKLVQGFNNLKRSVMIVVNAIVAYYKFWWNAGSAVVNAVISGFTKLVNFFRSAPGRIRSALSGMFNGLWTGFRAIVNRIVSGWNNLSFGIPGFSFAGISVPGISVGTPDLPYLAKGGMVRQEGLAYIHRGEKVTPAARVTPYRSSGGDGTATIIIKGDGTAAGNYALEVLREAIRGKGGDPVKVLTPR